MYYDLKYVYSVLVCTSQVVVGKKTLETPEIKTGGDCLMQVAVRVGSGHVYGVRMRADTQGHQVLSDTTGTRRYFNTTFE